MTTQDYTMFASIVLRTQKGATYDKRPSEGSFVNMLLCDFVCLCNLMAFSRLNKEGNKQEIARILARFSLLMLGAKALIPRIVERVWGSNPNVQKNLGGTHGDLALTRQWLVVSIAVVANNIFHLWLTTFFNDAMRIPPEGLDHLPPGVQDIPTILGNAALAIYVRETLHDGQDCINILLDNLRSSTTDPPSMTFEDIIVSWFREVLTTPWQQSGQRRNKESTTKSSKPTGLHYKKHKITSCLHLEKSLSRMASMFSIHY
jgi:hypothetical protein